MAYLRTAMDSEYWDLNIATPQSLHGSARAVPGESMPLDGTRASRALRIQQLSFLRNGFPLGIIPAYSPPINKDLGHFSLQSLLFKTVSSNWWIGLVGQIRPKKLVAAIDRDGSESEAYKDIPKRLLDKSLYSIALCSQLAVTPTTSVFLSTEGQGEKKKRSTKAMLFHKLPNHDITLEAAWPELFVDQKGNYWDVPESISLDCASVVSESGLRYRLGLHNNRGKPLAENLLDDEAPPALLPGLSAKAAFSYEKSRDIWRAREKKEDCIVKTKRGELWRPAYDVRLKEPHLAVSGIIGGTCSALFARGKSSASVESSEDGSSTSLDAKRTTSLNSDLFGSVCCTFQLGKFRKAFGDLSRIDARLNISSASALARASNIFGKATGNKVENSLSSPRLNLILQQQILGPLVFRVDSKFSLESSSQRKIDPRLEDTIYSLNYSLRLLSSGKVVAWYSPKRKEGMVELRLFEF
ncbi:hypothetical protein ACET3Z_026178 [Daucus carota]